MRDRRSERGFTERAMIGISVAGSMYALDGAQASDTLLGENEQCGCGRAALAIESSSVHSSRTFHALHAE